MAPKMFFRDGFAGLVLAMGCMSAVPVQINAAEIRVFSGGALKSAVAPLAAEFERSSGHSVKIEFVPMGPLQARLAKGERPDLVFITSDVLDVLAGSGRVERAAARELGRVGIGVAIREGAVAPDISTPEAFRNTLLAARSLVYIDPKIGTSGKHFAEVLERLGITEQMKSKSVLGTGGFVVEPVGRGEVEIGVHQISEILPVKGVRMIGELPAALQKYTVYIAVPPAGTGSGPAAALVRYLTSATARASFASAGMSTPPQ